uniref:Uncharacterized protein n=1 Tax=Strongyloides papillosus TaxID=174720 RepID=A0A0N5CI64_STREA
MSSNINIAAVVRNLFISLLTFIPNHGVKDYSKEKLSEIVFRFLCDYQDYDKKKDKKNEIDVFMNMLYSGLSNFKVQNFINQKEIEDFFVETLNKMPEKQKFHILSKLFQSSVEKYNDEKEIKKMLVEKNQ